MHKVYLLLGSNMGDSKAYLEKAAREIKQHIGRILRASSLYQTAAWGNIRQHDFLNQVLVTESRLSAPELMKTILLIEKKLGRVRKRKNAPRTIDIDILFYDKDLINEPELQVPHPQIPNRRFVLTPLNELSPQFIHPAAKKTIHYLLRVCADPLAVKKI